MKVLLHLLGSNIPQRWWCFPAIQNGILHTHTHTCIICIHIHYFLQKYKYKKRVRMGHQCLVEAYLRYGMMMSKDWHHVVCSGFGETSPEQGPWFRDRYKRHLSHNSWEAPRSQQWAFWRLYTVEKCWWERFFQGNLPLPQICCFPWARNVIVLKTCSVLLFIFFFFSILFWRVGGEMNLKWNTSFWSVWPDWGIFHSFDWIGFKSIQNTLPLPSGKVQL